MAGEDKARNLVSSTGYCYSDVSSSNPNIQTHLVNQIQNLSNPEIYNLTTGMDMIGFPTKNLQQHSDNNSAMWKGFFGKPNPHHPGTGPSSSKTIGEPTRSDFYQHEFSKLDFTPGVSDTTNENLMIATDQSTSWHQEDRLLVDDPSFRCVFPCEGNERPSQGLSLSLSSSNPSTIGLQSFELRQQDDIRFAPSSSREMFFGKYLNTTQQQELMQDGFLEKASNLHHQGHFYIRNSKYLGPAQELLNELCNLGTKQTDHPSKIKLHKTNQWQDENASSSKKQSLYSLDLLELQKRKTKLLQMLEEVDRRYKHYCDQMKAVVSSFEAMAGNGAARVYSALASKAMSRHFRCLRDGIVDQIKDTKKAMGEKDTVAPGATRGETPRLRLLDQTLRQQRAFQQMSIMESHPWRPQRGLPERSVSFLRAWLFEHFLHPYPSDVDKHILARQTGLSRSQVSNWFINARVRLWKPMVEEMYLEETKEQDNMVGSSDGVTALDNNGGRQNQNPQPRLEDQKPTQDQLVRIDSECLSSIINNPEKNDSKLSSKSLQNEEPHSLYHHHHQHSFGRLADSFGAVELDFSSYNHHTEGGVSYANENANHNFGSGGSGGGGVSLTLGLQQHGGSGVSLAFSSTSQSSLFYPRDQIEDGQPVQYSLLDGEGQNLPYRNLMGAQLLHDLA
ncbi:unnamed protein product [Ilex paraguariensis]|uniref:Homeobox domain-containing protein n=1 Tax=Ilex paraguariensis TaxID=185542 RepID=A0ABC8SI51_9AQUA